MDKPEYTCVVSWKYGSGGSELGTWPVSPLLPAYQGA